MNLSLLNLQILRAKTVDGRPQPVGMVIHPISWQKVKAEIERLCPINDRGYSAPFKSEWDKYYGMDIVEDYSIAEEETEIYFDKNLFKNRIQELKNDPIFLHLHRRCLGH